MIVVSVRALVEENNSAGETCQVFVFNLLEFVLCKGQTQITRRETGKITRSEPVRPGI